jgi:hypothetical protein
VSVAVHDSGFGEQITFVSMPNLEVCENEFGGGR